MQTNDSDRHEPIYTKYDKTIEEKTLQKIPLTLKCQNEKFVIKGNQMKRKCIA